MRNPLLVQASKKVQHFFNIEWVDDAIFFVNYEGIDRPIAQIIYQDENPDTVLISVAIDCKESMLIARLVLECMSSVKTDIAECFYISEDGEILLGEDAYVKFEEEDNFSYLKIPLVSRSKH